MEENKIDEMIEEYLTCRSATSDSELLLMEAALFAEEAFGIRLSDEDISDEHLGSPMAMRKFLRERLGV